MMSQRDRWKDKAKVLAVSGASTEEQAQAWGEYKKLRNKVNNLKGFEEDKYKKQKIEENKDDSGKVWKLTKSFMKWKTQGSPTQLVEDGQLITSAQQIACTMNSFFIDKVRCIREKMAKVAINLSSCKKIMERKGCRLGMSYVSVPRVQKLISSLSNSRSTALDELDNYSVKVAAPVIAMPLHHIVTLSLMQKKFPSSWKVAKVLPLHKKLDPLPRRTTGQWHYFLL